MNLPKFQQLQYAFAAHLRDPEHAPAPTELEDRRLRIYRDLFYNNIESFIAGGFPVLRKLYRDADWHALVRDFFRCHRCQSPYFLDIAEEFLHYLQNTRKPHSTDPPFLLELAHYEWVEQALLITENSVDLQTIDPNGDLLQQRPALSPLAWLLNYQWPVHEISPECRPQQVPTEPTHLLVYRDRQDKVRFVQLNPVSARLLEWLQTETDLNGNQALQKIIDELQHPQPDIVRQGGLQTLEQLRGMGIILGAYRNSALPL